VNTETTAIKMDELIKTVPFIEKARPQHLNALYDDNLAETSQVSYGSTEFIRDDLVKSTADMFIEVSKP